MNNNQFLEIVNELSELHIHQIKIINGEKTFTHNFDGSNLCDIRSISKTVMTMIFGIVKSQYDIDEHTFIYPIIKDIIKIEDDNNLNKFKKVQVKHLLTHTIGFDKVLLMRDDIKHIDPNDYLNLVVNSEIVYDPGSHYLYSNAGFYLLSVILDTYLDQSLLKFIEDYFFQKLCFKQYKWDYYGEYLAGATRLHLNVDDLIKIGELLLNDGVYNNQVIIDPNWIAYMKKLSTVTTSIDSEKQSFRRYAYGHGMWLASDSSITFGHGTDGQIVVSIKDKHSVIAVLSSQSDLKPLELIINNIIENYL